MSVVEPKFYTALIYNQNHIQLVQLAAVLLAWQSVYV